MLNRDLETTKLSRIGTFTPAGLFKRAGTLLMVGGAALVFSSSSAAVGDPDLVTYQADGAGVDGGAPVPAQIDFDPVYGSQALALDLGTDGATSATVSVSRLFRNEGDGGECGNWDAYDLGGRYLGSSTLPGEPDIQGFQAGTGASDVDIEIAFTDELEQPIAIRYLVFTALPYGCVSQTSLDDGSDYFVNSVSFPSADGTEQTTIPGCPSGTTCPVEESWSSLSPGGFDFGEYVQGEQLVGAEIIVDSDICLGGSEGSTGSEGTCEFSLVQGFKTTIENSGDISGKVALEEDLKWYDVRPQCGGGGALDSEFGTLEGVPQYASWNLGFDLGNNETGPVIPPHLCGGLDTDVAEPYPASTPTDLPFIRIYNINSTLRGIRSTLEATLETTGDVQCTYGLKVLEAGDEDAINKRRSTLPVVGWLPKTFGNPFGKEIPDLDSERGLSTQLVDLTAGCNGLRFSRYSFVIDNLHHAEFEPGESGRKNLDYSAIVADSLAQLQVVIDQTADCIDPGKGGYSGLSSGIQSAQDSLAAGKLDLAKSQLQKLLGKVEDNKQLGNQFEQCLYNLKTDEVFVGSPDPFNLADLNRGCTDDGVWKFEECIVPRNFPGELIARLRHSLYMFGRMLGVIDNNLPDDFKRPEEWGDFPYNARDSGTWPE